jgi:hypothetical protein
VESAEAREFEEIVFGYYREQAHVDYKSAVGWDDLGRRGQHGVVRDMMAMGNGDIAGYLVFGVGQVDGGNFDRTGLTERQAGSSTLPASGHSCGSSPIPNQRSLSTPRI